MPTLLDLFGEPVPAEVTGRSLLPVLGGEAGADAIVFGMFGGPLGVTDGTYSYFRYPENMFDERLGEYTLMPTHLAGFFEPAELKRVALAEPFDFTKGLRLLRYDALNEARRPPGLDGTKTPSFHSAVYDNAADPNQLSPISDTAVEARLGASAVRILRAHDAPPEYYEWMGFDAALS